RSKRDWSSDVCSSDLEKAIGLLGFEGWGLGQTAGSGGPGAASMAHPTHHATHHVFSFLHLPIQPAQGRSPSKSSWRILSQFSFQIGRASCRERVDLAM